MGLSGICDPLGFLFAVGVPAWHVHVIKGLGSEGFVRVHSSRHRALHVGELMSLTLKYQLSSSPSFSCLWPLHSAEEGTWTGIPGPVFPLMVTGRGCGSQCMPSFKLM